MIVTSFSRCALNASVAAGLGALALSALLAACANGANTPLRSPDVVVSPAAIAPHLPRARGWLSPEVKKRSNLIYVAAGSEVLIFREERNSPPIGRITDGAGSPYGLYVDRHGNLYVANWMANTVTAYRRGSVTPFATYSQELSRPLYPIVDAKGNLFVSNADSGGVIEYRHGTTSVYRILQTGGTEADGMDFDAKGNLYVAYRNGGIGSIETFAPGSTQGKMLGMQLDQPQGLIVANSGIVLAVETGAASRIDEFLPGNSTPQLEVPIPQTPVQLAITESENRLFVSTLNGPVYVTDYPLYKQRLVEEVFGSSQGVALSNGQYF
ncbi:MAG TPA: hypothetical protein VMT95_03110 [Candidatus Binatia bacterium]|nr:hypothetical protein [Candidatus Binatia bacterium]